MLTTKKSIEVKDKEDVQLTVVETDLRHEGDVGRAERAVLRIKPISINGSCEFYRTYRLAHFHIYWGLARRDT